MEVSMKASHGNGLALDHTVSVRIDKDLFAELQSLASQTRISMGTLIRTLLWGMTPPKPFDKIDQRDIVEMLAVAKMTESRLEYILFMLDTVVSLSKPDKPMVDMIVKYLAAINENLREMLANVH
jgi:hypothetical protein